MRVKIIFSNFDKILEKKTFAFDNLIGILFERQKK